MSDSPEIPWRLRLRPPQFAWRRWLKRLGCLVALACLGLAAMLAWSVSEQIRREGGSLQDCWNFWVNPRLYAFGRRSQINLLCLGVDYNHDTKGIQYSRGARSDTILLLSLKAQSQRIRALSIPRDLRLDLGDGLGTDKVNAAFSLGGARRSRRVIGRFLGLPIDYVLVVRVDAARELVDALGGMMVRVEKDMDYDDNWGNLHIHLKKGMQRLNGTQVVGYCRFRNDAEADFGRMRRQQQVLRSLSGQLSQNISPATLEKLVQIVRRNVQSDLSYSRMLTLARLFRGLDASKVKTQSLAVEDAPDGYDLLPNLAENRRQIQELLKD